MSGQSSQGPAWREPGAHGNPSTPPDSVGTLEIAACLAAQVYFALYFTRPLSANIGYNIPVQICCQLGRPKPDIPADLASNPGTTTTPRLIIDDPLIKALGPINLPKRAERRPAILLVCTSHDRCPSLSSRIRCHGNEARCSHRGAATRTTGQFGRRVLRRQLDPWMLRQTHSSLTPEFRSSKLPTVVHQVIRPLELFHSPCSLCPAILTGKLGIQGSWFNVRRACQVASTQ